MERSEMLSLPMRNVEDLIAAHLYAVGKLNDDEEASIMLLGFDYDKCTVDMSIKISKGGKTN